MVDLLGWSPKDAANRAAQSVYGISSFGLSAARQNVLLNNFAKASIETIELINNQSDLDNIDTYKYLRSFLMKY